MSKAATDSQEEPQESTLETDIKSLKEISANLKMDYNGNIAQVSFSGSKLVDAGLVYLGRLVKLRKLDLSGSKVTDEGMVHIKPLKSLREISLHGIPVSDAGCRIQKTDQSGSAQSFAHQDY